MHSKKEAVGDNGTFYSNAINSGNTNTLTDVCDNYQKVKEFFKIENEAFLVSAFLNQEGFKDKDDADLEKIIPENIKGDIKAMRRWFHSRIHKLLNELVMPGLEELPQKRNANPLTIYKCRAEGCEKCFSYTQIRDLHEETYHSMHTVANEECKSEELTKTSDDLFEYSCSHLGLGLLLHDADDAIKEGDGARLVRIWDFLIYVFRINGNTKYALVSLRLKAARLALLSPQRAHQLIWNRFVNTSGQIGRNISRDLRLEHINKVMKMLIKSQGFQNITDENVTEISKSVNAMENLVKSHLVDADILKKSGHHCNKHQLDMFASIFKEVHDRARNFEHTPGRTLTAFPNFNRNLFTRIDTGSLFKWIMKHRTKWNNQNLRYYNFA